MTTRKHRIRTRGAVFMEAVVVVSVLAGFFGAIRFFHAGLAAKIDAQQDSREAAFASSMSNCDSSPAPRSGANDSFSSGRDELFAPASEELEDGNLTGLIARYLSTMSTPITYGTAHAQTARSISGSRVATTAGSDGKGIGTSTSMLNVTVRGDSYVMCNVRPIDGNLTGFFEYGKEIFMDKAFDIGALASEMFGMIKDFVAHLF